MFEHGAWYTGAITAVDYIKSEKKGTPGLQITVEVSDRGSITGVWWLTGSLVNNPDDKAASKVPQWEAAQIRCKQFGCNQDGLVHPETWLLHIQTTLIGQQASVMADVNNYGDTSAQVVCKPKAGGGGGGFARASAAASPFAARPANSDPFAVSDEDLPF
jgi:hypothetical protein